MVMSQDTAVAPVIIMCFVEHTCGITEPTNARTGRRPQRLPRNHYELVGIIRNYCGFLCIPGNSQDSLGLIRDYWEFQGIHENYHDLVGISRSYFLYWELLTDWSRVPE